MRGLLPATDSDVSERSTSGSQRQARLQHARALLAAQCVASCPVSSPGPTSDTTVGPFLECPLLSLPRLSSSDHATAVESHCSPQRSPTERCWLFSFEHWLHDRNGQVKLSHSSEETTLQMHQLDTAFGATPDVRAIRRQSRGCSSPVQAAAAWYVRQVALRECLEASKTSSRGCFTPAICI